MQGPARDFIARGWSLLDAHLPAGDAELIDQLQLAPKLGAGDFPAQ